jgi:hypothetical protein
MQPTNAARTNALANRSRKFSRSPAAQNSCGDMALKLLQQGTGDVCLKCWRKLDARRERLDITADIYPYVAGSTSLSACLPPWALEGGTEKMLARLRDPAHAALKQEMRLTRKIGKTFTWVAAAPRAC